MRRAIAVVSLVLLSAACSRPVSVGTAAPAPPPQLDPVGVFDMTLDMEGNQTGVTLTIRGEPGAWTGMVDSDMGSEAATNIAVDGMELTFRVSVPEMTIYFRLLFEGDAFTGEFGNDQFGGALSGKRRGSGG